MNTSRINQIRTLINRIDLDETVVMDQLRHLVLRHHMEQSRHKESIDFSEMMEQQLDMMLNGKTSKKNLMTGFSDLDLTFGGLAPGEFVVLGSRPGMGKSQLLAGIALHVAHEHSVLYFSLDLSADLLGRKFLSVFSEVPLPDNLQISFSESSIEKLNNKRPALNELKLLVNEGCKYSIQAMRAECEKLVQEKQVKLIIVDQIQNMSLSGFRNNRDLEINYICDELRQIAKDLNVCVLASSQLSRAMENRGGSKVPHLSDLRDSGSIEQHADKLLFLFRPEYYNIIADEEGNNSSCLAELYIAKNRTGPLGKVMLNRDEAFTRFFDFEGYKNQFKISSDRFHEWRDYTL